MEQRPTSELTVLRDYLGAFSAVLKARLIFLIVVVLSLLSHIGAYSLGRWGDALEEKVREVGEASRAKPKTPIDENLLIPRIPAPQADATSTTPSATKSAATKPATTQKVVGVKVPSRKITRDGQIYLEQQIGIVLPLARFAGLAAAGLLVLTYLIGVNICLAGRMGGICHATSAFFWSIALIVLLFPWRHIVPGATIDLPDAFFTLDQLKQGLLEPLPDMLSMVRHYGRFIGCPVLAMLVSLVSGVRPWLAFRQVTLAVEPLVQMKVL